MYLWPVDNPGAQIEMSVIIYLDIISGLTDITLASVIDL